MIKKNSIFIKVLIPVIVVMTVQIMLNGMVLYTNGTITSLDDNAIESMRKNMENRSITLENMMVYYWSNLDKLEIDIAREISTYLSTHDVTLSEVLGSYEHETNLLYNLSGPLVNALRTNPSTGVYMYFLNPQGFTEEAVTCNGLYYRDLDPVSTPADNSDILFLRGYIDIARKEKIQLDSLWSELFTFTPDHTEKWIAYSKPQLAYAQYPTATSQNLSYWSKPHLFNPDTLMDANKYISYTRPLFYEGQLIAIIGTEVQINLLEKYFPASDFEASDKSGYMLLAYNQAEASDDALVCQVYTLTGSYIKRIISPDRYITLVPTRREGIYTIAEDEMEGVQVALQPLRLYNSNAPFSDEQWALAVVGADSTLFEASAKVARGILAGSLTALLIGCALLATIIHYSTKPIMSIARQIEKSETGDPIVVTESNTHEIVLLRDTLNAMRDRRSHAEAQLREERERYLVALESAADTFMEYDLQQDSFMLYYFAGDDDKPELCSRVTSGFMEKLRAGDICHPDDIRRTTLFLSAKTLEPVEVRGRVSLFSHITGVEPDGEYYWFLLKASRIYGDDGTFIKIIGTAKEITREKREEYVRAETTRRDSTTGFYNRAYGVPLVKEGMYAAVENGTPFALSVIHIHDFDRLEAYYGRVFGGALIAGFSRGLRAVLTDQDIPVRLTNDDFLVFYADIETAQVQARNTLILNGISALYAGENPDLRFSVGIGTALKADGTGYDEWVQNAYRAMFYAEKTPGNHAAFFHELPAALQKEPVTPREKPISVSLDISMENITGFVFELFEHTSDIQSAVHVLLSVLGPMYALRHIVICTFDPDFGANQVVYQWTAPEVAGWHTHIEKVPVSTFLDFETLLDENGTLLFDGETVSKGGEGLESLLCTHPSEPVRAYGCVMYENGMHMGRVLYKAKQRRNWTDAELLSLYEVSKIVAAHISIEKSHSASRAKSEFLSRVSHEIRTPMNAILGMTDIAKNSADNPARLADCLNKIDFSAKHLLSLINDVLEMSRIESGKLEVNNKPFSLTTFASGIDTLMRPPIENKQIHLVIRTHIQHAGVSGDEHRLRQVLVNLLGNANKFTAPGGEITFSIEELSDADSTAYGVFRFSVMDNGIGICQEDQVRIFKAFEQSESGFTAQERQGTGLGLAISGNIVSAMGSKIELNSRPGAGSEFYFLLRLPLRADELPEKAPEKTPADYTGYFNGKRALLAEDNEINTEIASYILGEAGIQLDVAVNGQEAVDKFFASAPGYYDIIFMDIHMPVMDGLTATRHIRKNRERPDAHTIPIIAMTANAFDEDMKKSINSGMNGHIAKPINHDELFSLLTQLIGP